VKPDSSLIAELTKLVDKFYEHEYIEAARALEQARLIALMKERERLIPPATD